MNLQRLLALVPALLGACQDKDTPDDTDASTGDTTGPTSGPGATTGEPTTGPACVLSECEAMCAQNHDEPCHTPYAGSCQDDLCVCEKQPDDCEEPSFPAVECGMMMCAEGQVCVQPGLRCDHGSDPPDFYTPAPECSDVPARCEDQTGDELRDCLGGPLCPNHDPGLTEYKDGQLTCPPEALDCF